MPNIPRSSCGPVRAISTSRPALSCCANGASVSTRCPIQTIRFYEQEGLLPPPSRSAGNFRLYGDAHVERLLFIRRCRSLDMTLDEIRVLLRLKNVPTQDCSEVNRVLEAHIEQVAVRIQELSALEQQLRSLREMCSEGRSAEQCGILCELSQPVSAAELAVP